MSEHAEKLWEIYTSSWKVSSEVEKRNIFASCLTEDCRYTDPHCQTSGWDELAAYMLDFHTQVPGGHFETYYFQSHHDRCIAKWKMKAGDGTELGDGVSVGEFDINGLLKSMTGFFDSPE